MSVTRLPRRRWFFRPFSLAAGAKRGVLDQELSTGLVQGTSAAEPDRSATTTCGICGKVIAEGEATVRIRHMATSSDPCPPLLPAHSVCFRQELLPRW